MRAPLAQAVLEHQNLVISFIFARVYFDLIGMEEASSRITVESSVFFLIHAAL